MRRAAGESRAANTASTGFEVGGSGVGTERLTG
jgi:hypothetical protein